MTTILLVDDDAALLSTLSINLRARGHEVLTADTGEGALEAARAGDPDVVILDLGLPDLAGTEVLRQLRVWSAVPVIVLSARHGSDDKVQALDLGADDYVTKPFGIDELVARLRAAVRRAGTADLDVVETDHLHIDLTGIRVEDPQADPERCERYAQRFYERRQRKGITLAEAREKMREPDYCAYMMVAEGDADGCVAGIDSHYPDTIRPALEAVGRDPKVGHVAGLYMMILPNDIMFFADTTVNIDPDAETLKEIALLSASFVKRLGIEPRVAMLSFSNFGSTRHPQADKVARATALVKAARPELKVDGEMQADTAVVEEILRDRYAFSSLDECANVLIFPDLNAANIAYKLMARIGGAEAVGPILLGMNRPVHVLQRGSEAADVVNLTALAVVDAQRRGREGERTR